jgi:ABC-type transport system substrate-binding protein
MGLLMVIVLLFNSCNSTSSQLPSSSVISPSQTQTQTTGTTNSTSTTPDATISKYGGILRTAEISITPTIGWPAQMGASGAGTVMQVCLETLLRQDSKGDLYPWLAESYKVADDLKSITFVLRKNIKFHDGSDFNAEVTKWNLENYIKAKLEPDWSSVDIIDDFTVRVTLSKWSNTIPSSFGDASTGIYMISKAAYDKNGLNWVKANPIGTGPFKLVKYEQDVKVEFVKNPDYWKKDDQGNKLPYLDGIEITFAPTSDTRAQMFLLNQIDKGIIDFGNSYIQLKSTDIKFIISKTITKCLIPDTADADSPWAKKEVREAAEYAIDREEMAAGFGYGLLQPVYQIPPPGCLTYNPDFKLGREYNPGKAKELLASAGFPDGFKTTMIVAPLGVNRDYNVALQNYFAKVGIQTELDFPEVGRFMGYTGHGKWPENSIMYMGLPSGDITYSSGLQFMFSMIGTNWERTPELTQAFQDAVSTASVDIEKVRAVTDIMTRDSLIIPVSETVSIVALQPYVMNSGYSERGNPNYWNSEQTWLNK